MCLIGGSLELCGSVEIVVGLCGFLSVPCGFRGIPCGTCWPGKKLEGMDVFTFKKQLTVLSLYLACKDKDPRILREEMGRQGRRKEAARAQQDSQGNSKEAARELQISAKAKQPRHRSSKCPRQATINGGVHFTSVV